MRRVADILVSAFLLILLSPLLVLTALAVKLGSKGPVFYRAQRVGAGGRPFAMLKFRSMVVGADRRGPGVTVLNDPRVTRLGRFLRATKIDELPQLVNVLGGQMTLVGPRPEAPRFIAFYNAEQKTLLDVKPGVTGPGQIEYTVRHEEDLVDLGEAEEVYVRRMLDEKLQWDLDYLRTRSWRGDLGILLRTAWVVLTRLAGIRTKRPPAPAVVESSRRTPSSPRPISR